MSRGYTIVQQSYSNFPQGEKILKILDFFFVKLKMAIDIEVLFFANTPIFFLKNRILQ